MRVDCGLLLSIALLATASAKAQPVFLERRMPYEAFDALASSEVQVGDSRLRVGFAEGTLALPRSDILAWVERSAVAVAGYYGRFPVANARILIVPADGRRVVHGQAFGHRGAAVRITLGADADGTALRRDWILIHEMVHLALPRMARRHDWLSEGLASYVEPVARAQAGALSAQSVWAEFVQGMPKGLPAAGDQGLDHTRTWGRTYWGGALFCLLADVEIRRLTDNRLGLQHAVRGVLAAGGDHEREWPIDRVLAAADAAVGLDVLARLHREQGDRPVSPDLSALWQALGVRPAGDSVTLDDAAPLASIRRAILGRP